MRRDDGAAPRKGARLDYRHRGGVDLRKVVAAVPLRDEIGARLDDPLDRPVGHDCTRGNARMTEINAHHAASIDDDKQVAAVDDARSPGQAPGAVVRSA